RWFTSCRAPRWEERLEQGRPASIPGRHTRRAPAQNGPFRVAAESGQGAEPANRKAQRTGSRSGGELSPGSAKENRRRAPAAAVHPDGQEGGPSRVREERAQRGAPLLA